MRRTGDRARSGLEALARDLPGAAPEAPSPPTPASHEGPAIPVTAAGPATPGIRRVDEWERIRAVFPSMETTVKVKGPPPAGAENKADPQTALTSAKVPMNSARSLGATEFDILISKS